MIDAMAQLLSPQNLPVAYAAFIVFWLLPAAGRNGVATFLYATFFLMDLFFLIGEPFPGFICIPGVVFSLYYLKQAIDHYSKYVKDTWTFVIWVHDPLSFVYIGMLALYAPPSVTTVYGGFQIAKLPNLNHLFYVRNRDLALWAKVPSTVVDIADIVQKTALCALHFYVMPPFLAYLYAGVYVTQVAFNFHNLLIKARVPATRAALEQEISQSYGSLSVLSRSHVIFSLSKLNVALQRARKRLAQRGAASNDVETLR